MKNKFILLLITPFLLLGCRNSGEHVTDSLGPSHYESYRIGEILKNELIENELPYGEFETIKTDKKGGYQKDYYLYNFSSSFDQNGLKYHIEGNSYSFSLQVESCEHDLSLLERFYAIFYTHTRNAGPKTISAIISPEYDTLGEGAEVQQYAFFDKATEVIYTISCEYDALEYKGNFREYEFDKY